MKDHILKISIEFAEFDPPTFILYNYYHYKGKGRFQLFFVQQ